MKMKMKMKTRYYIEYQRGRKNFRTLPKFSTQEDAFQHYSFEDMFVGTHLVDLPHIKLGAWDIFLVSIFETLGNMWWGFQWMATFQLGIVNRVFKGVPPPTHSIRERPSDLGEVDSREVSP